MNNRIRQVSPAIFLTGNTKWRVDGVDAGFGSELAHKEKQADTASETESLPEKRGFQRFLSDG